MEYAHPNVLVSTQWINDHLNDPAIRIVEVDYIPETSYFLGHIPGAVLFDWKRDIIDSRKRDVIRKEDLEESLQRIGVNNDSTIIVYGDFKNWFATFAFWIFKYYGVKDVRLMNGSRKKWLEEDRPINVDIPSYPRGGFQASDPDKSIRVFMNYVKDVIDRKDKILVDVRTNDEYNGKTLAPTEYSAEYGQMGGHIPGAVNVPWGKMVNEDGTLKSANELKNLYELVNVTPDKEIITYCGIGERASYTWFVLKYLLGYPNVKTYDGSWLEWGNSIGNPIEK
ncbi:MAG TPA: sulfurtransferase [Nitrososphaeraceae archaeon]|nr:sulfurtransferase [Nitrososphaeraceae archaeon]